PGNLVCQSPKEGGTQGFYYVCANNRTVVCRTDGDCPLKSDGNSGTCDTEKEVIANCPTLPQTVATPSFAQMCPAQANGCRLIEDPECTAGTSDPDKGTLRNDYGRGSTGVPCTRNYYFTGNLDDQSQECNGKINVEKGCLLFNDANQQKFEYRIVNNPPSIDPATLSGSVPYCQCDTNISEYSDCRDAEIAAASDPDVCYNRYTQDVAATGALLRKYEKIRLDLTYNSVKYYTQAKASANTGGSVDKGYAAGSRFYYSMNNTITPYSTLQDVTAGTLVSRPDANSLIKVKQDRQCKLWLKCTGYYNDGAREICFKRDLCNKWGKGNTCASIITDIPTDNPAVSGYIVGGGNGQVTTGQEAVRSLSGIARPDYMFPNYNPTPPTDSLQGPEGNYWPTGAGDYFWKTANGRNSNFSLWKQPTLAGISDRTYSKLESNPQYSAPYYSRALNSCRLYPEQYSPLSTPGNLVDACRVKSGSYGVYGFCLEPYPNYQLNYFPFRMVCTNNTDQTCEVDGDCGAGNKCAYRYYENACLTWFPVDRIDGQQNLFTSASGQEVTAFDQKGPVYVCVHKDALPADELINSSDVVVGSPGSFSDSLNNVAVGHPGTAYFTDGVISPSNPKALNLPLSEVGGVNYSGFSTNGKFGGPVKSGNYGDAYYFWKSGVEFDKHSGSCTPCELAAGGKDHSFGRVGSLQSECNNLKLNNFLEQDSATGDYLYDTPLMACYDFQSSCRKGGLGYNYVYGKIEPAYDPGTGKFKGWRHITCDTEKDDSTISINASLDIKPYTAKQTDKARYNGEYCSEFVKVVDENSNSVPVVGSLSGTSMSDFIKKTISSAEVTRVLTTTDPKAKKIILNGKQETCSYKTYADYDPTNNSTSCNWIPGSNILDAAVAPGGISPIKVFKIEDYVTTGDKDNIKFYFAKPYQYYLQDSTSSKYFEGYYYTADQDNLTKNWWDYARDSVAQSDSNRPRIYGKNKTEVNQFAYETFNGTGIAIRFYSDVNNAQMPIKKIKIDWDGGETTNVFNGTFEGRGLNETFGVAPDSGSEPKNSFHGHGPFYFDYGAPFDGKKVCVEVKDNWDAITTTCGTFSGSGNTGTVTFEVPNATDIP
ncbi:MAG: hypothetical protein Q8P56_06610, partial [Candidatus Uhrbacteria bacterium]|nr:hypothetical protein [Candidatus Uhrbacteria bacterium]